MREHKVEHDGRRYDNDIAQYLMHKARTHGIAADIAVMPRCTDAAKLLPEIWALLAAIDQSLTRERQPLAKQVCKDERHECREYLRVLMDGDRHRTREADLENPRLLQFLKHLRHNLHAPLSPFP